MFHHWTRYNFPEDGKFGKKFVKYEERNNNQNILKSRNKIKRIENIEKTLTSKENSGIITHVLETGTENQRKKRVQFEERNL